jgi:integrase
MFLLAVRTGLRASELVGLDNSDLVLGKKGSTGRRLSHDAVEHRISLYVWRAAKTCPSLRRKTVSTHTLRHYVDAWVMWPAVMFAVVGGLRGPVPAT